MSVMSVTEVPRRVLRSVKMTILPSAMTATAEAVIEAHRQMDVWTLGTLQSC